MKTISRTALFLSLVAAMLVVTGVLTWLGFHNGWDVVVDGETVTGVPALFYAFGGTLFGILVAIFAVVFAVLIVTGVSLFVVLLLAGIFAGIVLLLSPLALPLLVIVGLYMLLKRRNGRRNAGPSLPGPTEQVG